MPAVQQIRTEHRILNLRTNVERLVPDEVFHARPESVIWTPHGKRLAYLVGRGIERFEAVELWTTRPFQPQPQRLATLPSDVTAWDRFSCAP